MIDLEWTPSKTCPRRPRLGWSCAGQDLQDILHRYYGQRPIIYTTVDFYRDGNLRSWPGEFGCARSRTTRVSYPGQRYTFWQLYRHRAGAEGISGNADLNVFAGSPGEVAVMAEQSAAKIAGLLWAEFAALYIRGAAGRCLFMPPRGCCFRVAVLCVAGLHGAVVAQWAGGPAACCAAGAGPLSAGGGVRAACQADRPWAIIQIAQPDYVRPR